MATSMRVYNECAAKVPNVSGRIAVGWAQRSPCGRSKMDVTKCAGAGDIGSCEVYSA